MVWVATDSVALIYFMFSFTINFAEIIKDYIAEEKGLSDLTERVMADYSKQEGRKMTERFEKDMSGLDVLVSMSHCLRPIESDIIKAAKIEDVRLKTYNLSDVSVRWGKTTDYVKKQISHGMRMCKQPNGRWSITEIDLLEWEASMQKEQEDEARRRRRSVVIASVFSVIIVLIASVFVLWYFKIIIF
jgi:hypothetical protein